MNILFLGKIPPVQGGESISSLTFVRNLAREGHNVRVVTNSAEVELPFRTLMLESDELFLTHLLRGLEVCQTSTMRGFLHIPYSPAYSSKLFGAAVEVLRNDKIDLIIGWYFEPYSVLAVILGKIFGIRTRVFHAGSDISRLAKHPELGSAYRWMLDEADEVMTSSSSAETLKDRFGVASAKLRLADKPFPYQYFKRPPPFDIAEYIAAAGQHYEQIIAARADLLAGLTSINENPLQPGVTTIGLYGKVSPDKGNFELLEALDELARNGREFTFISLSSGPVPRLTAYVEKLLSLSYLKDRTRLLPFVPHWRIPGFIKSCDVVCFLENKFPVPNHKPKIPFEVISQGRCLVLSREARKGLHWEQMLKHRHNFLEVGTVTKEAIRAELDFAITQPAEVAKIGGRAKAVAHAVGRRGLSTN